MWIIPSPLMEPEALSDAVSVPVNPPDGAVRMRAFIYFPPKIGKFAGYMSEWYLEWNGQEFERVE